MSLNITKTTIAQFGFFPNLNVRTLEVNENVRTETALTQSEHKIVKNTHIHMHKCKNRSSNGLPAGRTLGMLELLLGSAPAPLWVALVARMDGGLLAPRTDTH